MRLVLLTPLLAGSLLLAAPLAVRPACAQVESREGIALQNQILELRGQVEALREQLRSQGSAGGSALGGYAAPAAGAAPSGDIAVQLLDRVSRLENEVRELRGHVDEIDNARQRAEADLSKQIGDINFKLQQGAGTAAAAGEAAPAAGVAAEGGGETSSPPPAELGAPTPEPPVPPAAAPASPEVVLRQGNAALARRDYAGAEAAARQVLATVKGPRSAEAEFLLAQALTGRRDYQGAAVAFDDAYKRNRKGPRAPDSLLGLANSLLAINAKSAACQALDKLAVEFPAPRQDLRRPISEARQRGDCR